MTGSEQDDASLEIRCDGGIMQVRGTALWGVGDEARPPHTGTLEFTAPLTRDGTWWVDGAYRITLLFRDDRLYVEEENALGYHGMNVTFSGEYARTARQ